MALTPVNCAAGVGCVEVGRDAESATPAKLLTQLNLDADYLECGSGGLRVAVENEPPAIPSGLVPAPSSGNLLRTVASPGGPGMFALAQQASANGGGAGFVNVPTVGNTSAISQTFAYTNNDVVRRIVQLFVRLDVVQEENGSSAIPFLLARMTGANSIPDIRGNTAWNVNLNLSGVGEAVNDGEAVADTRQTISTFVLNPGQTFQQEWTITTLRRQNLRNPAGGGFAARGGVVIINQGVEV